MRIFFLSLHSITTVNSLKKIRMKTWFIKLDSRYGIHQKLEDKPKFKTRKFQISYISSISLCKDLKYPACPRKRCTQKRMGYSQA
ncbi:hypothetical protein AV530_005664 [Patagioenas fasciata monilis]|uniref:Uncharacterized protein n=1 Tax=Patagioenas fasciata monilis TaxID=372326 RepID=A0A1V4JML5_PATFA|nr:hypothetical protein AV530_005664 [Patagioenas fasciata monilis]